MQAEQAVETQQELPFKRPPSLTVDEIERMQQQAYDEAFAQGLQEGVAKGLADGAIEGIAEGRVQGHAEGLQQGLVEAQAQQRLQAEEFINLMASLSEPFKQLDEAVEKQLVTLAIAIARQLVRREIKQNPGEIMAVVRAAVAVLPVAVQKLTLYLHPVDAELVKDSLALTETMTSWHIVEDPLLTQGGCKVTTDVSLVDATIEKRLASVIAMVLGDERDPHVERP
ncbi:MAG: flagellar assembly protein FliH [Methylococcaceae bacterium]|nr:flagellar assembly protein FliH [Methylococcaceae bacterium]